ncbi:MAG: MFS transporter [Rhodoferax sp.]|nr:MFS transporter [Rhodoferax sp.]
MSVLSRRQSIAVFAVFAYAYFFSALIRAITATLAPTLVAELSLNASDLGLLAGGYFLGFAAMQLPLGNWLDRLGPKRMQLILLSVAVVGCLAFASADSFYGLLAARVLTGVGVSACLMAPLTGYRRWFEHGQQLRANSWMLMAGAFGMVASTLPVQWLVPVLGWRPLFLGLAILVAIAVVLIAWQVPGWGQSERKEAQPESGGYAEVWASPYFRKMAPLGFFNYGGLVAVQTLWAAPWMVKVAGYSPLEAATGLFWINVAMLVSYLLWGWANPWLERRGLKAERLIAWGTPLSFILLAILIGAGHAISTGAAAVLTLYCVSCTVVALAQPAVGMAFPAELAGRALSAFNLMIFSGIFVVQWGVGLLIDALRATGWAEVAAYQGALGIFGLCCIAAYLHFLRAKTP